MIKYILLFPLILFGQQTKSIELDRPDQTETPAIVPKKMFQIESGFTMVKEKSEGNSFNVPSTLWKYGLLQNMELRLITELTIQNTNEESVIGMTPVLIGCKIKISEEKGILPKTSFIGHIALPNVASEQLKADCIAPQFRFTMQHTLSDRFTLGYNLGAEWDGYSSSTVFIYTVTSGQALSNRWGSYVEFFGFLPQKQMANHNVDGGFTYLLNDNTMFDVSLGLGLTENTFQHYFAFGFSFRI
jgi:Putative MetA-pathway of phenol degradation